MLYEREVFDMFFVLLTMWLVFVCCWCLCLFVVSLGCLAACLILVRCFDFVGGLVVEFGLWWPWGRAVTFACAFRGFG